MMYHLVLRALAAVGVFAEVKDAFGLTPLSKCLLSDAMRPLVRMFLSGWHNRAWDGLRHTIRAGVPGFESSFGMPAFEWVEANPDVGKVLDQGQGMKAIRVADAVNQIHDFSGVSSFCDLAGGNGPFLLNQLARYPQANGVGLIFPAPQRPRRWRLAMRGFRIAARPCPTIFLKVVRPPGVGLFSGQRFARLG